MVYVVDSIPVHRRTKVCVDGGGCRERGNENKYSKILCTTDQSSEVDIMYRLCR